MRVFCGGDPSPFIPWDARRPHAPGALAVKEENIPKWDGFLLLGPLEPYGSSFVDNLGEWRTHGPYLSGDELAVIKCPGEYCVFTRGETVPASVVDEIIRWRRPAGMKTKGLREQLAEVVNIVI